MLSIRLLYLICATSVSVYCSNDVPVILWGPALDKIESGDISALQTLSSPDLYDRLLKPLATNNATFAVFVEPSLSAEDLTSQDNNIRTFHNLQDVIDSDKPSKFIPRADNVEKALEILKDNLYEMEQMDSLRVDPNIRKIFIMKLDDARDDEDRQQMLKRHDSIVNTNCKLIEETFGNTVCIYSASRKSWIEPQLNVVLSRKLLQSTTATSTEASETTQKTNLNLYYYAKNNIAMVYTPTPPVLTGLNSSSNSNSSLSLTPTSLDAITLATNRTLNVPMKDENGSGKITLQFQFWSDGQTWKLENITVQRVGTAVQGKSILTSSLAITTSIGFSFHTPTPVVFKSDDYQLVFSSLQVEYFSKDHPVSFDKADDTVYFFTIPILSGLFVTSLLITIVLIGLSVIFDIKTMDLFDDPKGKTVTINASE